MTPEQYLDNQIKLWCGQHDYLCFHLNVGKIITSDKRFFQTGLPKGFPDLMIMTNDGKIAYCETKIKPRKPTKDQERVLSLLRERGFNAFVAYNLDEFIDKLNRCLRGEKDVR